MSDTNFFDVVEKVDILIKQSFGFPSTSENKQWYEETGVKFNNYLNGEELFLDVIILTLSPFLRIDCNSLLFPLISQPIAVLPILV